MQNGGVRDTIFTTSVYSKFLKKNLNAKFIEDQNRSQWNVDRLSFYSVYTKGAPVPVYHKSKQREICVFTYIFPLCVKNIKTKAKIATVNKIVTVYTPTIERKYARKFVSKVLMYLERALFARTN